MTKAELIASFLDNTAGIENYQDLGVLRFGKYFFPDKFTSEFSTLHYEMVMLFLETLMPEYARRVERQRYYLCHREASKSTIGTDLIPTYLLYLKGFSPYIKHDSNLIKLPPIREDFIVITSETSVRASMFVNDIKTTVETRGDLAEIFGEKNPKLIEGEAGEREKGNLWRNNAFVTTDDTVVWGLGDGQRIRGIKVNASRPTFIIVDDMYSRLNTKTEQTREHLNYWFFSELINSADSIRGKVLWLGTLLHPDTVITKMRKLDNWQGVQRPIIGQDELARLLDQWKKYNRQDKVPLKSVALEWQKDYHTLSWPGRHDLWYIMQLYYESKFNNDLNYFYQEYMNIPIAPELEEVDKDAFVETDLTIYVSREYNTKIQYCEFKYEGVQYKGELVLSIGLDPAVATSKHADDTVLTVSGYVRAFPHYPGIDIDEVYRSQGKVFPVIVYIDGGRYAIRKQDTRKGMAEEIEKLIKRYMISYISIEAQGQQKAIVDEIRRYLTEKNYEVPVMEEYTTVSKVERINSIIITIIQRYKKVICQPNPVIAKKLYPQLLMLGIGDHDDYPDSWAISMKLIQPPPKRIVHEQKSVRQLQEQAQADSLEWLFL